MSKYSSNLCTGGTAIANGGSPANAFDGSTGTYWESTETGSSVIGTSWIGYYFSQKVNIKLISIYTNQLGGGSMGPVGHNVSSIKISYSDDGSTWTLLETITIDTTSYSWVNATLTVTNNISHRYWRIMANAKPWLVSDSSWCVGEIKMYSYYKFSSSIISCCD